MLVDSHMHTPLCKHAQGTPSEYAEAGIKAGMDAIIFTCHSPMPKNWWPEVRMHEKELPAYLDIIHNTQQAYSGQLEVRLGLECDWFPGMEPWLQHLSDSAPWDFLLGSVHFFGPEYLRAFRTKNTTAFRRQYFDHLAQSAESGFFDCLSHPDLVKNLQPSDWNPKNFTWCIASALDRIATTGTALELNTSGLHKALPEFNPHPQMLTMMAERGIPVVLGSDSHQPHRVGENFHHALILLQDCGFSHVSHYKKRSRFETPIAQLLATIPA